MAADPELKVLEPIIEGIQRHSLSMYSSSSFLHDENCMHEKTILEVNAKNIKMVLIYQLNIRRWEARVVAGDCGIAVN